MVGWAPGRSRRLRCLSLLGVIALLLLAGCTGGGRSRPGSPGNLPAAGCPTTSAGDNGWQQVAMLAGSGPETSAEVTGMVARGPGGPWLAVGAARTGEAPATTTPGDTTAHTEAPGSIPTTTGATATHTTTALGATTTAPVGAVGVPAAGAALVPAVWTSADGQQWLRAPVEPVTLDGAADRLLGVARYGSTAAAVGVTFNHNEGVGRPSGWASRGGGPLQEARANRELFGGPAGLGVSGVGAGPLGLAILGLRNGSDNHLFIAVWRSTDGRVWSPPVEHPALTARPAEAPAALGVAVGSSAIVVGGRTVQVDDPADAVIWTGVPATTTAGGMRWVRVPPGPAGLGGAGAQEVDRVAWTGSGFVAAGLDGDRGRQQLVSWSSADGLDWQRGQAAAPAGVSRLTSLSAGDGGLLAAGTAGATACLWRSPDGRSWTAEPLPAAAASPAGLQGAFAAADAERTLLIVQGQGRAEVWARPSGRA
jgi:hypothetical protein